MNYLKPLLAFAAIVVLCGAARTVHADLLGYWPFEDSDGLVVQDASGNGNHGEASDTFAFTDDGFQGRAGDFGDFNNGAFVGILTAEDGVFDSIVDTQEATIAFWMNRQEREAASQWTFIFDGGSDSSDAVGGRQLASHGGWGGGDGTLFFDTGGCCGANQRINKEMVTDDGTAFGQDGEWHHLAYVRDVDDTYVYVDGELFHSSIDQTGEEDAITSPVAEIFQATIGANAAGGGSQAGLLDEFAIWDEALPVQQILALAGGAKPGGDVDIPDPGDFNADGSIDSADFQLLAANYNMAVDRGTNGDINFNGRVDFIDFVEFRAAFKAGGAAGAAAVPEPNSSLFAILGLFLTSHFARRRTKK